MEGEVFDNDLTNAEISELMFMSRLCVAYRMRVGMPPPYCTRIYTKLTGWDRPFELHHCRDEGQFSLEEPNDNPMPKEPPEGDE